MADKPILFPLSQDPRPHRTPDHAYERGGVLAARVTDATFASLIRLR
ncbi:hypothetical protein [Streptomyces avermitilis]